MNEMALRTIKSLSIVHLWLFIFLRSLCDKYGCVRASYTTIQGLTKGARIGDKTGLFLSIHQIRLKLGELAYLGIVSAKENDDRDNVRRFVSPAHPIRIVPDFMDIMPSGFVDAGPDREEFLILKEQGKRREEHIKNLNSNIKKFREEIKLLRSNDLQDIKTVKSDGSLDVRGVEFQRIWAWFVILGIQKAFEKIVSESENYEMNPDYKIMAVWLSVFGMDMIEGLLLKLYMNKKIDEIKRNSKDDWPGAVVRYIYGSLNGIKDREGNKEDKNSDEDRPEYEPAGGWQSKY